MFQEGKYDKVLVDVQKVEKLPNSTDIFSNISRLSRIIKCAGVSVFSSPINSDLRFIENDVVNRGIPLRIFYSKKEALKWLQVKPKVQPFLH